MMPVLLTLQAHEIGHAIYGLDAVKGAHPSKPMVLQCQAYAKG